MTAGGETQERQDSDGRDLLVEHSRAVVFGLCAVAVVLLALSVKSQEAIQLPSLAFGWKLGLDITRAAVVLGVVAILAMVLIRGYGGLWPYKVSTTGFDYEKIASAATQLSDLLARLDDLEKEMRRLRELQSI